MSPSESWTRGEWLSLMGLAISLLAICVAVTIPEIRHVLRLESTQSTRPRVTSTKRHIRTLVWISGGLLTLALLFVLIFPRDHPIPPAPVKNTIDRWISTFNGRDTPAHLSLYDFPVARFYLKRDLSRSDVAQELATMDRLYRSMRVDLAGQPNWAIQQIDSGSIEVKFDKVYRAVYRTGREHEGKVRSVLRLSLVSGTWTITQEFDQFEY